MVAQPSSSFSQDYLSPEAYLAQEEKAETKSEYWRGQVTAMAGASANHNRIAKNVVVSLEQAFSERNMPCETFISDIRLQIEAEDRYTYPDVMVVCDGPKFAHNRRDTLTNPRLIVEVLSDSTESNDRGDKFRAYWTLDSLQEYVLIDQNRHRVEVFRRVSEQLWELAVYSQAERPIVLNSLDVNLSLAQIYRNIVWETPTSETDDETES